MKYHLKESGPSGELFTSESEVRPLIRFPNEAFYRKDKMSEQFELATSNCPKFMLSTSLTSECCKHFNLIPLKDA